MNRLGLALLLLAITAGPAAGQIYHWTDGSVDYYTTHFEDIPLNYLESVRVIYSTARDPSPTDARPALVVTSVSGPKTGTRGSPISTSVTIQNTGSATAAGFHFEVYLSKDDAHISGNDPSWFCDIVSLAPTASTFCDGAFNIPSSIQAGTYFVVVRVDDGGVVAESNENDKVGLAGPITVN
jgi:subtilase family serine protease